jgi:cytosine/creatinine deaminase
MDAFLQAAIDEARLAVEEGGVPIGSVLVLDGQIIGRGHNRQAQLRSIIRHAEIDCIDNAGTLKPDQYHRAAIYTTLSPCEMCAGAIVFFRIGKVVIGENQNYQGTEDYLKSLGIEVDVLNDEACVEMLRDFDRTHPGAWNRGE